MLKASDLREETAEELRDKDAELSQQLFQLRLQQATGQLEATSKIREARRDRARVQTVLKEKTSEAGVANG